MLTQASKVNANKVFSLARHYRAVRRRTEVLCEPLSAEDYNLQSMPEASPVKWHLAHTTWFFETMILSAMSDYRVFHPQYTYLFNSYYESIGERLNRSDRGLLSHPRIEEIYKYREYVDTYILHFLEAEAHHLSGNILTAMDTGLHHEMQHQELILTDLKHAFAANPLKPAYKSMDYDASDEIPAMRWHEYPEGVYWIGHDEEKEEFAYDNEKPSHRRFSNTFRLASRLVTNREFVAFMEEGAYARPEFWLSDGWKLVQEKKWHAPLYWENLGGKWWTMTLGGLREVEKNEPVCHVSFYEADAFARWWGFRLPTETEWEIAAKTVKPEGNFAESGRFHPAHVKSLAFTNSPSQLYGDVWEWTSSAYSPYPGYKPPQGMLGEYNAKFMSSQMVLRGGSCVTPKEQIRHSYRNFFSPDSRWQFSGIRLAGYL
jgi:ergothioneine biosynthesis protein EgtB